MEKKEGTGALGLSVLDWILLALLCVAVFVGVAFFVSGRIGEKAEERTFLYTVRLEGIEVGDAVGGTDLVSLIPVGCSVYSENGTAPLGIVTQVTVTPHMRAALDRDKVVFVAHPDRVDVDVIVRASGVARDGDGLRVSDIRIAAGASGGFRIGGYYAAQATVVFVDVEE